MSRPPSPPAPFSAGRRPLPKRLLFVLWALAVGLLGGESVLQLLSRLSPRLDILLFPAHQAVPDEQLGHRPSPFFPGHDRKGFRNERVPEEARVVAIGDSQTYGVSLPAGDAWPRRLERASGWSVYSMAFGGYGPAHGLVLLEEALELRPKAIVFALYSGNDCYDSFHLVHTLGKLADLRSRDPAVLAAIEAAEREESLESVSWRAGGAAWARQAAPVAGAWTFLSERCALYGAARAARRLAAAAGGAPGWDEIRRDAGREPSIYHPLESGAVRTVLMPAYRLCALDTKDPRIVEGLRIALEALDRMHEEASRRGVVFLVLFLPTAELVFEATASGASMPPVFGRLLESEKAFWATAREHLASRSIPYADMLPPLRRLVEAGRQPYPERPDGHPNAGGSAAIAEAALEALSRALQK